jgi:HK97 family phage major capsid protein
MDYEMKAVGAEPDAGAAVVTGEAEPAPVSRMVADVEALKSEMDALRRHVAERGRPPLPGDAGRGRETQAFADRFLRKGLETGFELKRFQASVGADGGVAIPREIDQLIETTLRSISPIRVG